MKNPRQIILALIMLIGGFYLIQKSDIPSNYIKTSATVLEHRGGIPGLGSNRVARVSFHDSAGTPREGNSYDDIVFGVPKVGDTISIFYSPVDPTVIRLANPLNRKSEIILAFSVFAAMLLLIQFQKRNEPNQ